MRRRCWLRFLSMALLLVPGSIVSASCAPPGGGPTSPAPTTPAVGDGAADLRRFEFTRIQMGVQSRIVLFAPGQEQAETAAAAAFDRIAELDAIMSDYRPDSELMRLCDRAGGGAVPVSDDLFRVLDAARRVSEASDGAFDVTVGPAVRLWRASRKSGRLPPEAERQAALALVGWRNVLLDPTARTARLVKPGTRLDLGGVAKGYAAAEAVKTLCRLGFTRCLAGLAGDLAVGDPPPGKDGWEIAVGGAAVGSPGEPRSLLLSCSSVSTSGSTEQVIDINGVRYSHMIDPRTGLGIDASESPVVTAVGTDGAIVDAAATALCVSGSPAWQQVAERLGGIGVVGVRRAAQGEVTEVIDPQGVVRWSAGSSLK